MACVTGPRKRACMNTRRLAHRALAAATSLLVLGVATTANGQSPAHASSVSAASADRPSQGGLGAVTSASARVPAARFELHFRNLYPESAVFLVIAIRDHNCDHYQGMVSIGWWKLDYNVDRVVWAGELTDDNDTVLYLSLIHI